MPELPRGTVTFLFTDIEGSTRLWERDAIAMQLAAARHDYLLAAAITARRGTLYKHVGDAVQAAFPSPAEALAAAVSAQRALAAASWPETGPLQVRMALHLGEATPDERGDYHQVAALNRLARLLAAGHGGQILLTEMVRTQVHGSLPADVTLLDLGKHRLRDLLEPERVSQVIIAGLPEHFPPLKSLEQHPNNLPSQPSPLVGREAELAAVTELLTQQDVRLVTLTGLGGTGKTRLALQTAANVLEAFEDGAFFVDLAPLTDPSLVLPTIATTLGVREAADRSLRDSLAAYLAEKRLLMVLDNFEHVAEAAVDIAQLLATAQEWKVLATSRAPLRLKAEREFPVAPLPTPDLGRLPPLDQLAAVDAVMLFVQRAQAVVPDFALTNDNAGAVAAICARLDGLPLAIELAASRTKLLPPAALLARLASRLTVLSGGARDAPVRQRTLRVTMAWSHDLLSKEERVLFRRLAVFGGGSTLKMAEAVTNVDESLDVLEALSALVDQSLLRRSGSQAEPRYQMLETIREFALERLAASGEAESIRRQHAMRFLALAEETAPRLTDPDASAALDDLEREHDNLRTALAWTSDVEPAEALRLAGTLAPFWEIRGYYAEGRTWLERTLAACPAAPDELRAEALDGIGRIARVQGDLAHAAAVLEEALEARRSLGDPPGLAVALRSAGVAAFSQGDVARAALLNEEALALSRQIGDARGVAAALGNLAVIADEHGDLARAEALYTEVLERFRKLGDQRGIAATLDNLGSMTRLRGDLEQAERLHEEALALRRAMGDAFGVGHALHELATVAWARGDVDRAAILYEEELVLCRDVGNKEGIAASLSNLGLVAYYRGDLADAAALLGEGMALSLELGDMSGVAGDLDGLAAVAGACINADRAARLLGAAAALRAAVGRPLTAGDETETEQAIVAARQQLGNDAFTAAWTAGNVMPLADAVAQARALADELTSAVPADSRSDMR
jgi:predicted ATPase